MKISETLMTPALATTLLQGNIGNRTLSQQRVAAIASAIEHGEWQFDGNPVKVSAGGKLLDGQHRLAAVARAGKSVPMLLVEGLEDDAQLVLDSGKVRSFADYLKIRGHANHEQVSATTRLLWKIRNDVLDYEGSWSAKPLATNTNLWDLFQKEREAILASVVIAGRVTRYVRMSRSVASVCWMLLREIDEDDCEDFFAQLASERQRGQQAAFFARHLDNRESVAIRKGQLDQRFQMALVFKTWNAYREGREIGTLRWTRGGSNREAFPVPI